MSPFTIFKPAVSVEQVSDTEGSELGCLLFRRHSIGWGCIRIVRGVVLLKLRGLISIGVLWLSSDLMMAFFPNVLILRQEGVHMVLSTRILFEVCLIGRWDLVF